MSTSPVSDRCGHCDKDLTDTDVLFKQCSCCGTHCFVHQRCARKYYSWFKSVPREKFSVDKFQARLVRFFCVGCQSKECCLCVEHTKIHNVGEKSSFPVVCFDGHWFVATKKCAPKFKPGKMRIWFCPRHANQPQKKAVLGLQEPETVLTFTLPTNLYKQSVGPVKTWFSDGTTKNLSFLKTRKLSKFVNEEFLQTTLDKFRNLMEYSRRIHSKDSKVDKLRRSSNKQFMSDLLAMNRFSDFTDERDKIKSQLHRGILCDNTNENNFPVIVSPEGLLSIYKMDGIDGLIDEKVLEYFYTFLQEIVLQDNADKVKKVPHIFMEPTYLFRIAPPTTMYLNTDVNLIFYNKEETSKCEFLLASEWYNDEDNRKKFGHEYKHWFENHTKLRYDDVFDKLEELNEVWNCQCHFIHHFHFIILYLCN